MNEKVTREEFFQYLNQYVGNYLIVSDDVGATVVQFSYVDEWEEDEE